ncbi:MAG: hypothetical protein ABF254_02870 [Octadecabacter sp.]
MTSISRPRTCAAAPTPPHKRDILVGGVRVDDLVDLDGVADTHVAAALGADRGYRSGEPEGCGDEHHTDDALHAVILAVREDRMFSDDGDCVFGLDMADGGEMGIAQLKKNEPSFNTA